MNRVLVLAVLALGLLCTAPGGEAQGTARTAATPAAARKAPTRLYSPPPSFLLLRLGGDRAHIYYVPGSLDRAANLQNRMEVVGQAFQKWSKRPVELVVFLLSPREWEEAGIDVEYGIPVRVGMAAIAAPSRGSPATVALWSELLNGRLPTVIGTPILGTSEELASMMVSDVLVQVLAGEILVDFMGLYAKEVWMRGVVAHLAALAVARVKGTDRTQDLEFFYRQHLSRHSPKTYSLRDYSNDLSFEDWLYFQAQFHFAARAIFDKEGKDAIKKMGKLKKKGNGLIPTDQLRRKYKDFDAWLQDNFSMVSFQR